MVIISNGHYQFHLGPAAVEANKRKILDGFITGGYPTKKIKRWISLWGIDRFAVVQRLLKREENLPECLVYPLWLTELIVQFGAGARKFSGTINFSERIQKYGLRLFGYQATRLIKRSPAKIYHYRSGYGLHSVREAKRNGMIALCDHSIAHPAVLEYLVSNCGRLPDKGHSGPMNAFWSNILRDVDQADYVLVNSDFVKETFIHQGWDPDRIYVIYLGVDDKFLDAVPGRTFSTDSNQSVRLLFAGDFGPRKGAEFLIPALQQINDINWRIEIIGGIDPRIMTKFSLFFADPRVSNNGFVPRTRLAERLSSADVFVFPSLAEGSARVIFEALACGCYVITTPNSGSIVKDGVHGALIPCGDVNALEKAIRKTVEDREAIARVGKNNADLVRTNYRQHHYGERLFQLYEHLLKRNMS